jgi:dTDP-4-dehydrorhamnose reductase
MTSGSKKRLMITGGSGLLGSHLARQAAGNYSVVATYNSRPTTIPGCKLLPLDVKDRRAVRAAVKEIKPDVIIHTVALVNVDYCQEHPEEAKETNAGGAENVALAAKEAGARMIYISTDSVFDGAKGMYKEEYTVHPINTYAMTKLEGERRVIACLPDSVIVRTAFYGWSGGKSIAPSLAHWVVNSLRGKNNINMFTDGFFSPIEVSNLAEALLEIGRKNISGIYHVAGSERCSKYGFGVEIARAFGLEPGLIHPASVAQASFKAPRPKDISLDITKAARTIETRLLNVKKALPDSETRKILTGQANHEENKNRQPAGGKRGTDLFYRRYWVELRRRPEAGENAGKAG